MRDARWVFATILAMLAFISTFPDSAPAGWFVAETALSGSASLSTTAAVDTNIGLKAAGVTVECKGAVVNGVSPEIASPNKMSASSLTFNECQANENCTVTKTIASVPVIAELTEQTLQEDQATITPKTKTTLATIKYEGALCALSGIEPVTGKALASAPTGVVEETLQKLKATPSASGELKVGSSSAELSGSALMKLASGKTFSFAANAPSKQFKITVSPRKIKGVNQEATVTIIASAAAKPSNIGDSQDPAAQFEIKFNAECFKMYAVEQTCSWKVKYTGTEIAFLIPFVEDEAKNFARTSLEARP